MPPIRRDAYRAHIGAKLSRHYWVKGTTTAASTKPDELIDTARTEFDAAWDGATVLVTSGALAGQTALLRGGAGGGGAGLLQLDTPLTGNPAQGVTYEILKGWTFADVDEAIDWAHQEAYPFAFLPLDDKTTVLEIDGTNFYTLSDTWVDVTSVQRPVTYPNGAIVTNPTRWREMVRGYEYELQDGPTGQILELKYQSQGGVALRFMGKQYAACGAGDAGTSELAWPLVMAGALHWLYDKGAGADEALLSQRFEAEAMKWGGEFDKAKARYASQRQPRTAQGPFIAVVNDGSTVPGNY